MRYTPLWVKVLLTIVVLAGLPFAIDAAFFNSQLSQYVARHVNPVIAEEYAIDRLQSSDATEQTNQELTELADKARDPVVLERSVRTLSNNLRSDAAAALTEEVRLATDPRIRAAARAGAIENLATYYIYETYDAATLDAVLGGNDILRDVFAIAPDQSRALTLLEYGQGVSVRPYMYALQAQEYARAWLAGNENAQSQWSRAVANYDTLRFEMAETSPLRPQADTAKAASFIFAYATDQQNIELLPSPAIKQALDSSENYVETFKQFVASNEEVTLQDILYSAAGPYAVIDRLTAAAQAANSEVARDELSRALQAVQAEYPGVAAPDVPMITFLTERAATNQSVTASDETASDTATIEPDALIAN